MAKAKTVTEATTVVAPEEVEQKPVKVNFYAHVKKFSAFHIFSLYFWKLLYVLGCIAMLASVYVIPFITTDAVTEFNMFSFDFNFKDQGLVSILDVVMGKLEGGFNLGAISTLAPLLIYALFLLPAVIWAVVKLIKAVILLIFFATKKKMVVIENLAALEHKEHDFGLLNLDGLWWYVLIITALVYFTCVAKLFIPEYAWHTFDPFETAQWKTFGTTCIAGVAAISLLISLIYSLVRSIVKGKIKKHFGLNLRKRR